MTSAPVARSGNDEAVETLDRLLSQRWSCRGFLDDAVPVDEITSVVDAARRTPSWCNTQPWKVHILSGDAMTRFREGLVRHVSAGPKEQPDLAFPPGYDGVHADRRRASGWQLYAALGIEKGDRVASGREMLRNFDCFGAPHVAVLTTPASLGTYGAVDCGLFVQSFLLAAQARGIATVPQAALASQAPFIRDFLRLDEGELVLLGISFGYPDPDHPTNSYRTDRAPVGEIATFVD